MGTGGLKRAHQCDRSNFFGVLVEREMDYYIVVFLTERETTYIYKFNACPLMYQKSSKN